MNNYIKHKTGLKAAGIFAVLAAGFTLSAQSVTLYFRDSVVVNTSTILLQDVAQIHGKLDENTREKLETAIVGEAAPAGFSRRMNVYDVIQFMLKPRFENIKMETAGAKQITVQTDARVRCVGDFEQEILEYLYDNIAWESDNYTVSIVNMDREWRCYRKPSQVAVKGLLSPYPKGNIRLKLEITQDDKVFYVPVQCRVAVTVPVVCAKTVISRNTVISGEQLEIVPMDITNFRYNPIIDKDLAIGRVAIRTLTPGMMLNKKCIKIAPEIEKGDNVVILVNKGPIRVSVPARAREEGAKGDRIWVENLKTHKLIRVIVSEKGIVYLKEGESI